MKAVLYLARKMVSILYLTAKSVTSPHQVNTYRCQRQDKYKGAKEFPPTT